MVRIDDTSYGTPTSFTTTTSACSGVMYVNYGSISTGGSDTPDVLKYYDHAEHWLHQWRLSVRHFQSNLRMKFRAEVPFSRKVLGWIDRRARHNERKRRLAKQLND